MMDGKDFFFSFLLFVFFGAMVGMITMSNCDRTGIVYFKAADLICAKNGGMDVIYSDYEVTCRDGAMYSSDDVKSLAWKLREEAGNEAFKKAQ